jgi:hypothetical protein
MGGGVVSRALFRHTQMAAPAACAPPIPGPAAARVGRTLDMRFVIRHRGWLPRTAVPGAISNSSNGVRGGGLAVRAPGKPARTRGRGCRALASFRADGRAPPRSTGTVREVARRSRDRGIAIRGAGAFKEDRTPRARETPRAILHRKVERAQPDGQPASRTMQYQHGISLRMAR